MLLDDSRKHGLPLWSDFGVGFERAVILKGGGFDTRSRPPHAGPDEIAEPHSDFRFWTGLIEQVEALVRAGRIAEGLALLETGILQSEEGWDRPELLRLKGELPLLRGAPAAVETSEALFRQALDEARRRGALPWELRAATSLVRLLRDQGRLDNTTAILLPVYNRFTEGFDTADLVAAQRLLDELSDTGSG